MTSRLIGRFVLAVEVATRERHGAGPLTRYDADLVVPDDTRAECAVLKAVAAHFVMHAEERVDVHGRAARGRAPTSSRPTSPTRSRDSTPTCSRTGRPPTPTPPRCGWSSTRWPRSPTCGRCTSTAPGADRAGAGWGP